MENSAVMLRISPRARRWRLSVGVDGQISLSVPSRLGRSQIEKILSQYAGWIAQQQHRHRERMAQVEQSYLAHPGKLPLLGEWIDYPTGPIEPFYRREAKAFFTRECEAIADRLGRPIGRLSVRDQKTRWGSCSLRGNLSFNWRLVKAPLFVARYVAAHECAHLVHPNHSRAFWQLNASLSPDLQEAQRWLKTHAGFLHTDPWCLDG